MRLKKTYTISLSLLILLILNLPKAQAQREIRIDSLSNQNFKSFFTKEISFSGLSSIKDLTIDSTGMLWISAKNVILYNGNEFLEPTYQDSLNWPISARWNLNYRRQTPEKIQDPTTFFVVDNKTYRLFDCEIQIKRNNQFYPYLKLPSGFEDCTLNFKHHSGETYLYANHSLYIFKPQSSQEIFLEQLIDKLPYASLTAMERDKQSGSWFLGNNNGEIYQLRIKYFQNWVKGEPNNTWHNIRTLADLGGDSLASGKGAIYTPDTVYKRDELILTNFSTFYGDGTGKLLTKDVVDKQQLFDHLVYLDTKKGFKKDILQTDLSKNKISLLHPFIDTNNRIWALVGDPKNGNRLMIQIDSNHFETRLDLSGYMQYAFYNKTKHSVLIMEWREWETLYYAEVDLATLERGEKAELRYLDKLTSHTFRGIHFDNLNWYWTTIRSEPMRVFFNDRFHPIPTDYNGALNNAHNILEDEYGYFWISTNNGIVQAYKPELQAWLKGETEKVYYHWYGFDDGVVPTELNGGEKSGVICKNGNFAFASLNGPIVFKPENMPIPKAPSHVVLAQFTAGGMDQTYIQDYEVEDRYKGLEFQFSTPYFGNRANAHNIDYALFGPDIQDNWEVLSDDGVVLFSYLPPGSYELKIRIKDGFGINNFKYQSYPFKVSPMWYETHLATFTFGIGVLLVFGGLFWLRTYWIRKESKTLTEEIKQQTSVQEQLNTELKLKNVQLEQTNLEREKTVRIRNKIIGLYIHDIRGPLRFIWSLTDNMAKDIVQMNRDAFSQRVSLILKTSEGIYSQAERTVKWVTSDESNVKIQALPEVHLPKVIDDSIRSFQDIATFKNIQIYCEFPEDIYLKCEPNVMIIVLNNLLDNAIKFSHKNGVIQIGFIQLKEFYCIQIIDQGTGMTKEKIQAIKTGETQSQEGTKGEKGKGFGLNAIKALLENVGAFIEIESVIGKGTTISLYIPQ